MRLWGTFISYIKYFGNAWMFYNIYYFWKLKKYILSKEVVREHGNTIKLGAHLNKRHTYQVGEKRHLEWSEPVPSWLVSPNENEPRGKDCLVCLEGFSEQMEVSSSPPPHHCARSKMLLENERPELCYRLELQNKWWMQHIFIRILKPYPILFVIS